jgi:hypothetical protein
MALNGAALVADVSTGGMGGGLAVRAVQTAKVVNRVANGVQAGQRAYHVGRELYHGNYKSAAIMAGAALVGKAAEKYLPRIVGRLRPGSRGPASVNSKSTFPEDPHSFTEQLGVLPTKVSKTQDNTLRVIWRPNENTRIRFESHPHGLSPGDPGFNPRHHGPHYHVETKPPDAGWGQSTKVLPPDYTPGSGTGFLPGEPFPGLEIRW